MAAQDDIVSHSLRWLAQPKSASQIEKYLTTYIPQKQRAFSRAHFEQPDFMIRYGRFYGVPSGEKWCISDAPAVKDIAHIIIDCKLYSAERTGYLEYLKTTKNIGAPRSNYCMLLSAGNEPTYH